ncbi:SGNH hydrolase domain-containing protein [Janibacter anophelis]|uniref:SGNH hydrolase domain-containing protein n=2 Tax=Janibacter anophelis TaxID=319054 RepID=UPI00351F1A4C
MAASSGIRSPHSKAKPVDNGSSSFSSSRDGFVEDERSFWILAVLLWAACTLPSTILMLQSGRVFGEVTPYTPGTQVLRYGLIASVLAWSLLILVKRASDISSRPLGVLILLGFAIFFPATVGLLNGDGSLDEFFTATVSFLLALALFSYRLRIRQLSIIAALGAATGAVSLGMALYRPSSAYTIEEGGQALAGPFNNSNYLGTVLILALPFVPLIRNKLLRLVCATLTVLPIVLGGSQTSIATLGVLITVGLILMCVPSPTSKGTLLGFASAIGLVAMSLLPLIVSNRDALTGRGAIWLHARTHVSDFLPFGAGRGWFADSGREIGFPALHAHHLLLDPLIVGGIPYFAIVLILLLTLIRFGIGGARNDFSSVPGLFTIALIVAGGLGNFFILDLRDLRFTTTGFVIITLLSLASRAGADGRVDQPIEPRRDAAARSFEVPAVPALATQGHLAAAVRPSHVKTGPSIKSRRVRRKSREVRGSAGRPQRSGVIGLSGATIFVSLSLLWTYQVFTSAPPYNPSAAAPSTPNSRSSTSSATTEVLPKRIPRDGAAQVDQGVFPGKSTSFRPPLEEISNDIPFTYDDGCHLDQQSSTPVSCKVFVSDEDAPTVALIGDSHAAQWSDALRLLAMDQGWNAVSFTKSACAVSMSAVPQPGQEGPYTSCSEWNQQLPDVVESAGIDLVLTSNSTYFTSFSENGRKLTGAEGFQASVRGHREARSRLAEVAPVVEILDLPVSGDQTACLSKSPASECSVSQEKASLRRNDVQRRALEELPSIPALDFTSYICQEGTCPAIVNGVVTFRDSNHITAEYSRTLTSPLRKALRPETAEVLWDQE